MDAIEDVPDQVQDYPKSPLILVEALVTSRVRVAGPQRGRRGVTILSPHTVSGREWSDPIT